MDKQKTITLKGSKQEINDLLALFEDGQIGEFDNFSILDIVKIRESSIAKERSQPIKNISNWLQGVFEAGWQDLNDLVFEQPPQLGWRLTKSSQPIVIRAKVLDLGTQLASQSIALVVAISEDEPITTVRLVIYPMTNSVLPVYLNLKVIDESDNIFADIQAGNSANLLQSEFNGYRGDHFSIQLSLGEIMLTEEFVI